MVALFPRDGSVAVSYLVGLCSVKIRPCEYACDLTAVVGVLFGV
jgi:hypothetical protein